MSSEQTQTPSPEVAYLKLQSSLDVGLTKIGGQLDVILQRLDQQDRRGDDHASQLATLDGRVDTLERTSANTVDVSALSERVHALEATRATKEELKSVNDKAGAAVTREDMNTRSRKTIAILAVIVTALGVVSGAFLKLMVG